MTTNETTATDKWSLWDVEGHGTLLLTEDRGCVLVQTVELDLTGADPVATSKSPSAGRTVLAGEGGHTERFETVLVNHLEIFGIGRENANRVMPGDNAPAMALAVGMRNYP
ncbi:hypothetical protein HFO56_23670 [Rhizobium laguerreae]|uniref:hypothetical protein n=1 Tax=Rhizobium laguerreae TaxID=1076926 RepID=UPI001C90A4DF|nr:hypothetical protein [Rhizobium laguerreae]MBY3155326.1 hypothetical protein [Rhizobium laguerreae]